MPNFTKILGTKEGGDHANRLKALREDLEDGLVLFLIYMPSVRKFFCEDVPRVVRNEPQVLFSMLSRGSAIANTARSVKHRFPRYFTLTEAGWTNICYHDEVVRWLCLNS